MTTKTPNRSHIIRAAWSHARLIAETLGQPIRSFIGATMRTAWALAKGLMPAPIPDMVPTSIPAMVPTPCQQQQANAGAIAPAPETQPNFLSEFEIELHEKALTKKFDLAVHKHSVLHEVYKETSLKYWESRRNKSPNARRSKQEAHDRHVSDEMSKRGEAALVEMNVAFDALKDFWRQRGMRVEPLLKVAQPVQQQQANAARTHQPKLFGYELTKRWLDEQGELREDTWPCVFGKPEDAAPLRDALIAGKGDPSFYGPCDAECGACLDIEAVYL